ncbi:MAG: AAA family ATPase [Paludibacter sp.]|nr:AAA family ATPase [Paludibacter sp.]
MDNLSPFYHFAREFAIATNRSIFLTGKAGTGKTTFLHNLQKATKKQMAIVAPTGVAAINAGGTTMHSFFQLPFTPFVPTVDGRKELIEKTRMQGNRRKVLQELELLVIDEISMVRADVLDAVDTILRHFRYRQTEPFGGVQVIFIGDMYQLPPVAIDEEWRLLSPYYKSPYFFHSQVVLQQQPVYIELDKIFRQTNMDFIRVLNEVRNNCLSESGLKLLQSRYNPLFVPPENDTYITLTTHNYKADRTNADELAKLKTKSYFFEAEIEGDFPEKSYPNEKKLHLKIGAKVMFIKNDNETPRRFYNGKIGIIKSIEDDIISIKCPGDNEPIELGKMIWENIRYSTNETTKQIEEKKLGTFEQYPLRLAWAITIHKSQGLTFDKAVIDAGDAFAAGQVYVALSRCRSLEGMVLWSKINPYSIENDRQIVEYNQHKLPVETLEIQLIESRNQFRSFVLAQLFDYRTGIGLASRLLREVESVASSFNDETVPFLIAILKQIQNIQEVADKFQHQLQNILNEETVNEDFLSERLNAATGFFTEKIANLLETMRQSPATTDSRENSRTYNDQIKTNFGIMAQKLHLLKGLKHPFTVEGYFMLKNTFLLPDFSIDSYSKTTGTSKSVSSRNPKLYFQLLTLRNQLCEPRDLPIYLVAGSATLIEMADYLPLTENDLLKINGFGPAKVEKYGSQFLKIIRQYCEEYKLTTQMEDKKVTQKERKEKKPKGDSHRQTLELFKTGKTIDQIAVERGLAVSTICSHLYSFVNVGLLDINKFISAEKREMAIKLMDKNEESGSAHQMLGSILNNIEINFFLAWMRSRKSKSGE